MFVKFDWGEHLRYVNLTTKEELKKLISEAVINDPTKDNIEKVSLFGSYLRNEAKRR